MEKKKPIVFNIVNIVILCAGLVLLLIQLFTKKADAMPGGQAAHVLFLIANIVQIIALIFGAVYMICRYSKKAAILYKLYMYSFTGVAVILALIAMTAGSGSLISSLAIIAVLVLSAILASARDFGMVKTFIIAALLLICQIILLVVSIKNNVFDIAVVSVLILILEAWIMAIGKYRDKAERGTR